MYPWRRSEGNIMTVTRRSPAGAGRETLANWHWSGSQCQFSVPQQYYQYTTCSELIRSTDKEVNVSKAYLKSTTYRCADPRNDTLTPDSKSTVIEVGHPFVNALRYAVAEVKSTTLRWRCSAHMRTSMRLTRVLIPALALDLSSGLRFCLLSSCGHKTNKVLDEV